ncbi:FAD/FMN-containing dehydrogenase [Pseudochelatococcus lubricantis]|uniref:FAD/FMN-containing dehydrogenase n=1 Tax=Pseudochelatococcus lubricantis TaxID=1538102 RepID=A0ABX0V6W8_9HYPH|nr:FAD-linked oxidase C-terminal domain-containing protein [Pseudochelatococcus lubricantis]NIJ58851.1 FAD/FMN-containing dehydrogenase [Pseudochelatococcus lubricantis]
MIDLTERLAEPYPVLDTDIAPRPHAGIAAPAQQMNGTFLAEHGVGLSRLAPVARHKDPAALDVMRAIKAASDPKGILNPGKTLSAIPTEAGE